MWCSSLKCGFTHIVGFSFLEYEWPCNTDRSVLVLRVSVCARFLTIFFGKMTTVFELNPSKASGELISTVYVHETCAYSALLVVVLDVKRRIFIFCIYISSIN